MYGEKMDVPIKVAQITDPQAYYGGLHGSQLLCRVIDQDKETIARGFGMSWNEEYQMTPIMEYGKRHCVEIVTGAMPPGQIQIQTLHFMHLNDSLPTQKNLASKRELTVVVQINPEIEDVNLRGLVIDVFEGCIIRAQQGNWNAQSLYMRSANLMYRKRKKGIEWAMQNGLQYPAKAGGEMTFDYKLANNKEITSMDI